MKLLQRLFGTQKPALNKPDVSGELKTATTKATKFRQSLKFEAVEQFYYDQARQMMLDNGFASMGHFINDELPNIPAEALKITKERFGEILMIAQKDYMTLMLDPHGLQSGF